MLHPEGIMKRRLLAAFICLTFFLSLTVGMHGAVEAADQVLLPAYVKGNDKWGYVNLSGKIAVPAAFTRAYPFVGPYARVELGNEVGYIDRSGKLLFTKKVDSAYDFTDGLAVVSVGKRDQKGEYIPYSGKYGYINSKGQYVVPPQYMSAESFRNGVGKVTLFNGTCGYINKTGSYLIAPAKQQCFGMYEKLIVTYKEGTYFYYDTSGNLLYQYPYHFNRDLSKDAKPKLQAVRVKKKYGFADSAGRLIIPPQWDFAGAERGTWGDGLIPVRNTGKPYGYINEQGKYVLEPVYSMARTFSGGMAPVKHVEHEKDYWRYIDRDGNDVLPPKYLDAYPFVGDIAIVREKVGKEGTVYFLFGLINRKGEYVVEPQFEYLDYVESGYYQFYTTGTYNHAFSGIKRAGYLDSNGRILFEGPYTEVSREIVDHLGKIIDQTSETVWVNGKQETRYGIREGIVDLRSGKIIVPPIYNSIQLDAENKVISSYDRDEKGIDYYRFDGQVIYKP
ncbi:WG repeat-containing protein [Brevibacillus centrosporus]|nr:WG repeat-containing protein [Brevibacillus centrosporus]